MKSITARGTRLEQLKQLARVLATNIDDCKDPKNLPQLAKLILGADLLYHEATYPEEFALRATQTCHSTASQAATVARDAQAKRLIIGHFSARIHDEEALLKEAQAVFPPTILAKEGLTLDV